MNLTLTSNSCGSRLVVIFENLWKSFFHFSTLYVFHVNLRCYSLFRLLLLSFYLSCFIDRKSEFNINRIVVCVTLAETRALQKNIYFGAKLICEHQIWIFTFAMIKIRTFHSYKFFGTKQTLFMKSRETATWTIMFAAKRNHCTL